MLLSFRIRVLSGYMSRRGIVGSNDNYVFCFLFSIVAVAVSIPSKSGGGIETSPRSICYLEYLMMVVLTSVWYYHIVVLICVSLILSDLEIPFMCLLALLYFFCGEMPLGPQGVSSLGCLYFAVEVYELFVHLGK